MGLFKSIKKAFKKVVKGVKKVVKKVVKGVKKVVKKIGSSKILKALAIAAAVVVTGGAALGAFGGSLATSTVGSWMVGASQSVLGGTLFGSGATGFAGAMQTVGNFATKMIAKPFGAVGTAAGNVAGAVTDFTGLTSKAGRMGYTETGGVFSANADATFKAGELKGTQLADYKAATTGTYVNSAGQVTALPTGQVLTKGVLTPMNDTQLKAAGFDPATYSVGDTGEIIETATGKAVNVSSSEYLTGNKWGDFALKTGTGVAASVASGYAQSELMSGEASGTMTGLSNESKEYQDALKVYADGAGFNMGDIYGQMTYGTADPVYQINSELYRQQTVGMPEMAGSYA